MDNEQKTEMGGPVHLKRSRPGRSSRARLPSKFACPASGPPGRSNTSPVSTQCPHLGSLKRVRMCSCISH